MTTVVYRAAGGGEVVATGRPGESVMQLGVRSGVTGIVAQCGGNLSCATCHVMVDPASAALFPAPAPDEDEMLDCTAVDRTDRSRLSCQLLLTAGQEVVVELPDTQV